MFLLIPWRVDVPQDRWPVMNWLIILALVCVFIIQVADLMEHPPAGGQTEIPGITGELILDGWHIKGLLGYMWLHGGLFHLFGNILFLWIFGNAVCAKVGNLQYLGLYVLFGVAAGVAHLVFSSATAVGASGAINGVVGMYLVLFYENEITCLFAVWFIILLPYIRWFSVGSMWLIFFWLFWDIVGALIGGAGVAYFAHLGGFAAGFGITWLMCMKGWITMERYEKSLVQMWQERKARAKEAALNAEYIRSGSTGEDTAPLSDVTPVPSGQQCELAAVDAPGSENSRADPLFGSFIHTVCACGKKVMVSQEYAGKSIRCSECGQIMTIPLQSSPAPAFAAQQRTRRTIPASMQYAHVRFTCHCGKTIKVPARYAGCVGKCPHCGAKLKIPDAPAEPEAE